MRRSSKVSGVVSAGTALALLGSGLASADTVYNTLDGVVDTAVESTSVVQDASTTITLRLTASNNNDASSETNQDSGGCALGGGGVSEGSWSGDNRQLKLTATSDKPSVLEVTSPTAFLNCADINDPKPEVDAVRTVTVTGKSEGTANITFAVDAGASKYRAGSKFALTTAKFEVTVTAPADPCAGVVAPAAPAIAFNPATPNGSNGWYKTIPTVSASTSTSGATIEYSVDDGRTYASTAPVLGQGSTAVTARATSATCDMRSTAVALAQVDTIAPTITPGNVSPAGWRNSSLTGTFTASDNGSGLATDQGLTTENTFPLTASAESTRDADGNVIATSSSKTISDVAGNTTTRILSAWIDKTAPNVSYTSAAGTKGSNGWYVGDVTATFTGVDSLSGPASATDTATSSGEGPAVRVNSPVFTDAAANASAVGAAWKEFKIDKTAPDAPLATLSPAPNAAFWNNSDVTVQFTPNGDNGGSGVASCTADVPVTAETTGQVVSGTCTDNAGHVSSETAVTVKLDKTRPVISETVTVAQSPSTHGWYKSDVVVTFTATDTLPGSGLADDSETVTSSGEGAAVAVVSPTFKDRADNAALAVTKTFQVDKTAPAQPTFVGGPPASYYFGDNQSAPTCTAVDGLSGLDNCQVTGGGTSVGSHSYTATATDKAGNTSTATLDYTVLPWTMKGFYSPVDMGSVWNTVKGGSTVPLKFEIFKGSAELTDTAAVKSFTQKTVACPGSSATVAEIELVTTGGTSLRYDTTAGQFVQNWQTPKSPGSCYTATMTTQDGSTIAANFMLK